MSKIQPPLVWLGIFFLIISLSSASPAAKDTVIYIVRHAEKDQSDPKNNDPELSNEGKERARALNRYLKREKISAVFSTSYKRTMQTAAPVARRNGIPVRIYDAKKHNDIVKLIKSEYLNQKSLLVGHSNTILELVKAFGLTPPVDKLNDDDYDLIFVLTFHKNGETSLKTKRFGKRHHSTEMPVLKSASGR